jgi:folate-binding protein YgfZ
VPELEEEAHVRARPGGIEVGVVRAGDVPGRGYVLHVPPEGVETVFSALKAAGAVAISPEGLDVLRIEDGRPWYGPDVTEENLLHETGLLREYHSPAKGCYVGQEVVARLEGRGGHVNKMMRGLRLGSPAARGDAVAAEGKDVGRVTTAGVSSRFGPVALAYVHRSRSDPAAWSRWGRGGDGRGPSFAGGVKIYTRTGDRATLASPTARASARHAAGRVPRRGGRGQRPSRPRARPARRTPADALLAQVQKDLFAVGAQLADPQAHVGERSRRPRSRLRT